MNYVNLLNGMHTNTITGHNNALTIVIELHHRIQKNINKYICYGFWKLNAKKKYANVIFKPIKALFYI